MERPDVEGALAAPNHWKVIPPLQDYIQHLESQLTWRPITECPDEWKDGRPLMMRESEDSGLCSVDITVIEWEGSGWHYVDSGYTDWFTTQEIMDMPVAGMRWVYPYPKTTLNEALPPIPPTQQEES